MTEGERMTPEERDRLTMTEVQLNTLRLDVSEIQKDVRAMLSMVSEVKGAVRLAFIVGAVIVGTMNIANIVVGLWFSGPKTTVTVEPPLTIEKAPDR